MATSRLVMNDNKIRTKINARVKRAQLALDAQIITDSDPFVPYRTGRLLKSVLPFAGKGELVYNTEYAKAMYYGTHLNFNKTRSALAGSHWFEKAKTLHKRHWLTIARNA